MDRSGLTSAQSLALLATACRECSRGPPVVSVSELYLSPDQELAFVRHLRLERPLSTERSVPVQATT